MEQTTGYHLKKPGLTDFVSVQDLDDNFDTIDEALLAKANLENGRVKRGELPELMISTVATEGTGAAYTASVTGITALTAGLLVIILPHTVSTSTAPTLNINSLGAKTISRASSGSTAAGNVGYTAGWISEGKPLLLQYDGSGWVTIGQTKPRADDMTGTAPVANGGTGRSAWTANRLVYPDGTTSLAQVALPEEAGSVLHQSPDGAPYWETPADTLEGIGGAPLTDFNNHKNDATVHYKKPLVVSLSLPAASWTGSDPYSQAATITGLTATQMVSLQAGSAALTALDDAGAQIWAENNNGALTIYARGGNPTVDMTVQAVVTEVRTS